MFDQQNCRIYNIQNNFVATASLYGNIYKLDSKIDDNLFSVGKQRSNFRQSSLHKAKGLQFGMLDSVYRSMVCIQEPNVDVQAPVKIDVPVEVGDGTSVVLIEMETQMMLQWEIR